MNNTQEPVISKNNLLTDEVLETPLSYEELFNRLNSFGYSRIMQFSNGWYAVCEVFSNILRSKSEICSDFGHKTPHSALTQLINRLPQHKSASND